VPSCSLAGKQLDNFCLYDLEMQPWEFRQHRGRVVLLDFWGTWCAPCLQAVYHLKGLQDTYGRYGLEIIGIEYERDGSIQDQIRRVQRTRDRLGINYRVLLGSDLATCPVRTQFGVNGFPTLVLIDENHRIVWQQERLDSYTLQELEVLIRR